MSDARETSGSTVRRASHRIMRLMPVLALLAAMTLAGCAIPAAGTPAAAPSPGPKEGTMPTQEQISPLPTPTPGSGPQGANPIAWAAQRDLAQRLGIPEDQVEIVSIEKAEMPVGSLGCGETEGRQNLGLIIGEEIVLRAQGEEYVYHSDGRRLVPCAPTPFPGATRNPDVSGAENATGPAPQALAVADLARRLDVPESAITVRTVESVEWPDASLGCPQPGMMYAQVITPGYRIVLEAGGKRYEYHTSQTHAVLCSPRR